MNIVVGIVLILAGMIVFLFRFSTGKMPSSFWDVWNIVCGLATLIGLYLSLQQTSFNNINEKTPLSTPAISVKNISGNDNLLIAGGQE
jgi:hypothetical protein